MDKQKHRLAKNGSSRSLSSHSWVTLATSLTVLHTFCKELIS